MISTCLSPTRLHAMWPRSTSGVSRLEDLGDLQRLGVDRVRDLFWRGAAVCGVELDAEVSIRTAGVMAGREDKAAEGLVLADHAGGGRRGENAAGADQKTPEAVCGGDADDGLDRLRVIIAAIPADHERVPGQALGRPDGIEDRLDEVCQVVAFRELGDLLAQAAGARLHTGNRGGRDALHGHGSSGAADFILNNPRRQGCQDFRLNWHLLSLPAFGLPRLKKR